ncbi:acyltransferase [Nocardioides sp. ChNu-153]|uniref:acyltransferase n=1 Tax=unclassified Nocardioides TaxID=2615069 RepID=UPI0024050CA7|nr:MULTISPECIES: acyltransferase [unclassified Nocardioides]MDF9717277.1 acyltransferase [Nocardioides sp. ChNu-99]MDN7120507.1 acyltransferase [Nocardioides sp. ChNu-153]
MSVLRRVGAAVRLDAGIAWRHLVLGVVAGSALVPRPLRWLVYRAAGLDVRTRNVFSGVTITGSALSVGERTFVNHDCYLDVARGRIEIGADCHLAPQVMVLTATHGRDEDGRTSRDAEYLTTRVGDNVWLGARATLLPGAVVEDGCVVAAGAVVTGRLTSGGVYAGVPARRVREVAA